MTSYTLSSVYFITDTLKIPAGTQMVGEAWSVIMGGGPAFSNMSEPTVMVQAGAPGSSGILEITDIVFTTQAPGVWSCCFVPQTWLTSSASPRRRYSPVEREFPYSRGCGHVGFACQARRR